MYPFADMQIGQCFTVPVDPVVGDAKKVVTRLQRAIDEAESLKAERCTEMNIETLQRAIDEAEAAFEKVTEESARETIRKAFHNVYPQ